MSGGRYAREYGSARYKKARAKLLAGSPKCFWGCGRAATTADHSPALADSGGWHWNLVPACAKCNYGHASRNPARAALEYPGPSRDWYGDGSVYEP